MRWTDELLAFAIAAQPKRELAEA